MFYPVDLSAITFIVNSIAFLGALVIIALVFGFIFDLK